MKLDYNIVWFENNIDFIDELREDVENYLSEIGFKSGITFENNGKNVEKIMRDIEIDLILMDQFLDDDDLGNVLISQIRDLDFYTEVVFYSALDDLKAAKGDKLEGVYYATKDTFFGKTKKVIDLTLKKHHNISNLRGFFIAEAIDIAGQLEEIITKKLIKEGDEIGFFENSVIQEEFFTDVNKYKIVQRLLKNELKKCNEIIQGRFEEEEKESAIKFRDKINKCKSVLNELETEVIVVRNQLAHAKPSTERKDALICKGISREFTMETCKEIRRNFLKHEINLEEIMSLLNPSE